MTRWIVRIRERSTAGVVMWVDRWKGEIVEITPGIEERTIDVGGMHFASMILGQTAFAKWYRTKTYSSRFLAAEGDTVVAHENVTIHRQGRLLGPDEVDAQAEWEAGMEIPEFREDWLFVRGARQLERARKRARREELEREVAAIQYHAQWDRSGF